MKEIDETIKAALKEAVKECGSVLKLSRLMGVSHSTVLFWSSGRTRCIDGDVWRYKVFPVLEPYLRGMGKGAYGAFDQARPLEGAYACGCRIGAASRMREVPVIGLAQAAGFDPALEPFESYAKGCGEETALFATEPKAGYFALRIEGESMHPEFPDGTLILVAGGEFVKSGDIVAARIRSSGQVVVKRYLRSGSLNRLESINLAGAVYEWDCSLERGYLEWMHPVVEAKVDLRARRIPLEFRAGESGAPASGAISSEPSSKNGFRNAELKNPWGASAKASAEC